MRSYVLLMCLLLAVGVTQAELIQHLDASKTDSVVGTPSVADPDILRVTSWVDQSGNNNNAGPADGSVYYPSPSATEGGFPGMYMDGTARNTLQLFGSGAQGWLNMSGATEGGFTILIAFKCDGLGTTWNDVIGNSTTPSGLVMRYNELGIIQWGGTPILYNPIGEVPGIAAGESQVWSNRYDASQTAYTAWISGTSGTQNTVPSNFSANTFKVGGMQNATRYMHGVVGEIKIYDEPLNDADLAYQQNLLTRKWAESRAVVPLDGGFMVTKAAATLEWKNLLPETEGEDVYVNIWYGTDPNRLLMSNVLTGALNATTATVDTSVAGDYYWAVDTSFGSAAAAGDPNLIEGPIYSFTAVDDPAPQSVDAGPDWATWANEPVTITAAVVDMGTSDVTVTFSSPDPNLLFSPNPVVIAGGGGDVVTTATIDYDANPDDITVTVTAEDAINTGVTVDDTITLTVYATACEAARLGQDGIANNPEDLVLDGTSACVIDLADFAAIAAKWLENYEPKTAFETPAP